MTSRPIHDRVSVRGQSAYAAAVNWWKYMIRITERNCERDGYVGRGVTRKDAGFVDVVN